MLSLNETPVRTSRNFNINNIKLEDASLPNDFKEFKNIKIEGNCGIIKDISNIFLTYGNGNELTDNIIQNSNSKIKINSNKKENIKIVYTFDDNNINLSNVIEVEAENDLNLTIEYLSRTSKKCFHNGILKVHSIENSNINITIVNLMNNVSENFDAIESKIEHTGKLDYEIIDLGAKYSISNLYTNVIGNNAVHNIKSIYIGTNNEVKDINYIVDMLGEKSFVDIDVQGALKDNSKKHFKGTIDFKKGCKKAKGSENEYCMLLSDKAKSIALPMLLCTEEDVEGNHSTASGKIEKEKLFYIMSRGFSKKDAIKLIVKSNFNKILEKIQDEESKNIIIKEIDRRLS